jgi:hypothetical protein
MSTSASWSAVGRSTLLPPTAVHNLLYTKAGNVYCRLFHRSISHPVNGKYRCWKCLREFQLGW